MLAVAQEQGQSLRRLPRVCFVGRFKTGKSRLINALVGADILPYDTDECTGQLIELVYGERIRACRLLGPNLDTAQEEPLTWEQFQKAVNLTQMSDKEKREAENAAYRCYVPSPLLRSIRMVDTPGFDGTNPETRRRAEQAREQAVQQSSLCVLVITKNAGEEEIKFARFIQQYKIPLMVVLNHSDEHDVEEIQEIQEQTLSDLKEKAGVTPLFFACSALWQNGSAEDRKAIEYQRRDYDDTDEAAWHQWEALVRSLSRSHSGEKHLVLLATIHQAFVLAQRVHEEYDFRQQAEAIFLQQLPRWQAMMPSVVGKAVLEIAVSAARSGKPLPWKRLENFGIVPEDIAPKSILPTQEIKQMAGLCAKTISEIAEMAQSQHSPVLYRYILSELPALDALLKTKFSVASELTSALKSCMADASWYSQPLRTDFRYEEALSSLQSRWKAAPETMPADDARVRQRLGAALA